MSFENIQLPPYLLQDLYKNFLIDYKNTGDLPVILKNGVLPSLGCNKKNILIIINEKTKLVIDKEHQIFLQGILLACKLTIEDILLINLHHLKEVDYTKLVAEFKPAQVLLFGVEPNDIKLPLHFPHNQIQKHVDQEYVSFPALKNISLAKVLKQALWATLQKLFIVK